MTSAALCARGGAELAPATRGVPTAKNSGSDKFGSFNSKGVAQKCCQRRTGTCGREYEQQHKQRDFIGDGPTQDEGGISQVAGAGMVMSNVESQGKMFTQIFIRNTLGPAYGVSLKVQDIHLKREPQLTAHRQNQHRLGSPASLSHRSAAAPSTAAAAAAAGS
eukprot:1158413-Pelagomonas_calceolata.AAC.2